MPSGLTQHEKALAWARSKLGEHEQPMGTNRGPFVQSCQSSTSLGGTGWPWCVAFVVKAWTTAGRVLPYRGAGAYNFLDAYRKLGWAVPLDRAKPGDAVIWNIGSGHLSMLDKPYDGGDSVHTVDGNVSDSVALRSRPASLVRGCVHIPEADTHPPVKPARFEIVTSESGHTVLVVSARPYGQLAKLIPRLLRKHRVITIRRAKK